MSNKKNKKRHNPGSSKKDKVLAQNKKRTVNPISMGVIIVLIAVIAVMVFNNLGANKTAEVSAVSASQFSNNQAAAPKPAKAVYNTVEAVDGIVSLDTSLFEDGKAKYFSFESTGKTVNFFVLKSSDNVLRAAFDSCDVCYAAKKGYRQEGDLMVCNNCGQQFPSVRINVEQGGCNPAPLERNIVGDKLVLNVPDIETGLKFF
jgi:uncharacterized membrane protein